MARLGRHLTRSVAVSVGALVAATLPTVAVDGAEVPADAPAVVFYTPLAGQTVPIGQRPPIAVDDASSVHLLLGARTEAKGAVKSIKLDYRREGTTTWLPIGRVVPDSSSGVFEIDWHAGATGRLELQATGYDAATGGAPVGAPEVEPVTLSTTAGTRFDFVRPDADVSPLGAFRRADGHWFARSSGWTSGADKPTAVDATPGTFVPRTSTYPAPTGTLDAATRIFRVPVDLSSHANQTTPGRAVIRVSDSSSSDAAETPLYFQTVSAVNATMARVPGSNKVTVTARVTDQTGAPVVGAVVRLTGYANGSRTPINQLAVTDAYDGLVTFTGPGVGSGPAVATGYAAGFYTAYVDLNLDGKRGARELGDQSVVGKISYVAPGHALYHNNTRTRGAGGTVGDSLRGTRAAAARGYQWIDQDGQLSYTSRAGLRGGVSRVSQPAHLTWVNAHGAPFNPHWLKKGRFETRAWSRIKRPGLRNAEMTFKQNAAYRLSVEWEVKDIRPFTTPAALNAAFTSLAASAQRYYGAGWRSRVQVKMLSNLSGGPAFALKVLKAAHAHGFTTIYLARGRATQVQIPAAAHEYVTYVRGARAGLYASS